MIAVSTISFLFVVIGKSNEMEVQGMQRQRILLSSNAMITLAQRQRDVICICAIVAGCRL
jgi:hypothetical protein